MFYKVVFDSSLLVYDNVDWVVNEVTKMENKFNLVFKNTKKGIIMTKEFDEYFESRYCEKSMFSDKVKDHCHLTGKYRSPANKKCSINVTQKQSIFFTFVFHIFSKNDCDPFFKKFSIKRKIH